MHLLKLNLKHLFQLKNVRERLAKNLTEKGVLTTEKQVSRSPRFESWIQHSILTQKKT